MQIIKWMLVGLLCTEAIQIPPRYLEVNHQIYHQYSHLGKYQHLLEPNMFSLVEKYNEEENHFKQEIGNNVVKTISTALPYVDNIGHKILHANDLFINSMLNNPVLDHETQKSIILMSIKLAQYGDEMGGKLLDTYYNIVDYCL